jgi:uncharacterized protein (DUF2236 family)
VPLSWPALQDALAHIYASGAIVVGADARMLAHAVIHPRGTMVLGPVNMLNEVLTAGLLPPAIREAYGFRWTATRARTFEGIVGALGALRRGLPERCARWAAAREHAR